MKSTFFLLPCLIGDCSSSFQMEYLQNHGKPPDEQTYLTKNKDLTNIETASPGLLASAAETDRGEGDIGHIGHLGLGQVRPP